MAEAYYEPTPATDGATMNPVPGAVFQVFEIADTTFSTPLGLRVGAGNPTTTVTASDTLATLPGVYVTSPNYEHIWVSGSFQWRRDSIDGAKLAIAESAAIAQSVKAQAESGAFDGAQGPQGERGLPGTNAVENDVAFAAAIATEGTETNTALSATIAEEVQPVAEGKLNLTNGPRLGSRLALMSDSTGQAPFYVGNAGGNDPAVNRRGETWLSTASLASKGRIRAAVNASVSGNTTQQMLDRFDADLGARAAEWDTLVLLGGVNDQAAAFTPSQTRNNLEAMAQKALRLGKNVIFCTTWPSAAHASRVYIRKINPLIAALAAKYQAPLVDLHAYFLDPATASWKAGFNADSLHPNLTGVNAAGKYFAQIIEPLLPTAQTWLALDALDTRIMINGSSFNPFFNIDNNADGIPDGFSLTGTAGGYTVTWENDVAFDPDAKCCHIVGIEAATGPRIVNSAYASDKWAVGDLIQVALKVKFTPGTAGVTPPKFALRMIAPGSTPGYAFQQELLAAHDGVIVSEPFTVPTGTTALSLSMETSGGALDVKFSRPTPINLTKQAMV